MSSRKRQTRHACCCLRLSRKPNSGACHGEPTASSPTSLLRSFPLPLPHPVLIQILFHDLSHTLEISYLGVEERVGRRREGDMLGGEEVLLGELCEEASRKRHFSANPPVTGE